MNHINFITLNESRSERVTADDIDPVEMAGVIDRSILPVREGGQGWALNRRSGYYVRGEIGGKRSMLVLVDETAPIATLCICMHSRASESLWLWLHDHAAMPLPGMIGPPPAPWACLRYDVDAVVLPDWLAWWAKTTAWALASGADK